MKKTLIIGASENPERYSFKAIKALREHGHEVVALASKEGRVGDVIFETEVKAFENVDTVSMYVNPKIQESYLLFIEALKPRRVIFNPGTENREAYAELEKAGIACEEACTLVLLATEQY